MLPNDLKALRELLEEYVNAKGKATLRINVFGYKSSSGKTRDLDLIVHGPEVYQQLVKDTISCVRRILKSGPEKAILCKQYDLDEEEFHSVAQTWIGRQEELQVAEDREESGVFTLLEDEGIRINHCVHAPPINPPEPIPDRKYKSNVTKINTILRSQFALHCYQGKVVLKEGKYERLMPTLDYKS